MRQDTLIHSAVWVGAKYPRIGRSYYVNRAIYRRQSVPSGFSLIGYYCQLLPRYKVGIIHSLFIVKDSGPGRQGPGGALEGPRGYYHLILGPK